VLGYSFEIQQSYYLFLTWGVAEELWNEPKALRRPHFAPRWQEAFTTINSRYQITCTGKISWQGKEDF